MLHFFVAFQCFDSEFCRFSSEARVYKKSTLEKNSSVRGGEMNLYSQSIIK